MSLYYHRESNSCTAGSDQLISLLDSQNVPYKRRLFIASANDIVWLSAAYESFSPTSFLQTLQRLVSMTYPVGNSSQKVVMVKTMMMKRMRKRRKTFLHSIDQQPLLNLVERVHQVMGQRQHLVGQRQLVLAGRRKRLKKDQHMSVRAQVLVLCLTMVQRLCEISHSLSTAIIKMPCLHQLVSSTLADICQILHTMSTIPRHSVARITPIILVLHIT